jgi:hypothetical protein
MLCYRDMTFCNSENHLPDCRRQLTAQVVYDAKRWWMKGGGDPEETPIAVSPFCDVRRKKMEEADA